MLSSARGQVPCSIHLSSRWSWADHLSPAWALMEASEGPAGHRVDVPWSDSSRVSSVETERQAWGSCVPQNSCRGWKPSGGRAASPLPWHLWRLSWASRDGSCFLVHRTRILGTRSGGRRLPGAQAEEGSTTVGTRLAKSHWPGPVPRSRSPRGRLGRLGRWCAQGEQETDFDGQLSGRLQERGPGDSKCSVSACRRCGPS